MRKIIKIDNLPDGIEGACEITRYRWWHVFRRIARWWRWRSARRTTVWLKTVVNLKDQSNE